MRDDLLHAQASVDWAESQFPAFQQRIETWLSTNVEITVEYVPAPATHNPIVAVEKEPLPLSFNVELGAYINAIRSSLDIMAGALAHRHGVTRPEKVVFPIVESEAVFLGMRYRGNEFVKQLPPAERSAIEFLKPYDGGNEALWSLHSLDATRKHRRLIDVDVRPVRFSMIGAGNFKNDFVPIATGWLRVNEKTVLGLIRKSAPNYNMKFIPHVAMSEPGFTERKPVIATLLKFSRTARAIIETFDAL